ncbi:hypothetical protein [Geodermatophilus sp. URMC 64]
MKIVVPDNQFSDSGGRRAPEQAPDTVLGNADALSSGGRTLRARRRVLTAQLGRLGARVGDTDLAARDAADRARRLTSRLERGDLDW